MTSHGPNLDFDGPIPLEIHAKPLAQAQAAYDAHMAKRVIYDPKLPCDHPHNEAARRWADKLYGKDGFKTALDHARMFNGTVTLRPAAPMKANPSHGRKSLSFYVAQLESLLDKMASLDPISEEWASLQRKASSMRANALARARVEEDEETVIPTVPSARKVSKPLRTIARYVQDIAEIIRQMNQLDPRSMAWKTLRCRASNFRSRCQAMAKTHGIEPKIPQIPISPDAPANLRKAS